MSRIYESDIDKLKAGISKKVGVELTTVKTNEYLDKYISSGKSLENVEVIISYECNEYLSPPCDFSLFIYDKGLQKIANVEKQDEANEDF